MMLACVHFKCKCFKPCIDNLHNDYCNVEHNENKVCAQAYIY